MNIFLYWMWLWVLDGIGMVQNDPFDIITKHHDMGGEKGIADEWVDSNTWSLRLTV